MMDDKAENKVNSFQSKDCVVRLEDVKLMIGDTLQLQPQNDEARSRFYVKLIGYTVGQSVLVTTPVVDGRVCLMREGHSFVVRCFSGKNAYAFQTVILKVVNSPFPHLLLGYPREVRGIVVRKGSRVGTSILGAAQVLSGERANTPAAVQIRNLSVGGALLSSHAPLGKKGDTLLLKFRLNIDDMEANPQMEAVIRNVTTEPETENGEEPDVLHGVEFQSMPQVDRMILTAFVYKHMLQDTSGG